MNNNANVNMTTQQQLDDILQLSVFRHGTHVDSIAQELVNIAGDSALKIFDTSGVKTQTLRIQQRSKFESFTVNQKSFDDKNFAEYMLNTNDTEDQTTCANYPNMYEDDTVGALYVMRRGSPAMECSKTSVNCVYCTDESTDTFIKIQMHDTQDPMINEVINAIYVADSDAFLQYESHCLIPYWSQGKYCKTLHMKPILRPRDGWRTLFECRKVIMQGTQGWSRRDNDMLLVEIDRIIGIWKEKRVEHNDLHLNNIYYNTVTGKMKIIDYGRMWIPRDRIPLALVDDCKRKYGMKESEEVILDKIYSDAGLLRWQLRDSLIGHMCDMVTLIYNILRVMKDVPWPHWFIANQSSIRYKISGVYAYMLEKKRDPLTVGCNAWDAMAFFALCCHALQRYVLMRETTVSFPEGHLDEEQILSCMEFVNNVMYPNRTVSPSKFAPIGAIVKQILHAHDGYDIIWARQGGGNALALSAPRSRHNNNVWRVNAANAKSRLQNATKMTTSLINSHQGANDIVDDNDMRSIPFAGTIQAYTFDPQRHYYLTPNNAALIRDAIVKRLRQTGAAKRNVQKKGKEYRLYTDRQNRQKYIRKSNKRWFLHEHRGQYRYATATKSHVHVFESAYTPA